MRIIEAVTIHEAALTAQLRSSGVMQRSLPKLGQGIRLRAQTFFEYRIYRLKNLHGA